MCIHIQSVTYMHPDKDVLFSNVSFSMGKGEKVALIGNNGSGKFICPSFSKMGKSKK